MHPLAFFFLKKKKKQKEKETRVVIIIIIHYFSSSGRNLKSNPRGLFGSLSLPSSTRKKRQGLEKKETRSHFEEIRKRKRKIVAAASLQLHSSFGQRDATPVLRIFQHVQSSFITSFTPAAQTKLFEFRF